MGRERVALGAVGEELAARFLQRRGHEVLARRFRNRWGELDLVSRSGEHLYFVEVKTRSVPEAEDLFGGGFVAVSRRKQRRQQRLAETFIARERLQALVPHFAVLVVEPSEQGRLLRFLPDAFDAQPD